MSNGLPTPPWLPVDRLLLVVTGSASAAFLPYWANLLRATHPDLAFRVVLTRSAERFVTSAALAAAGAERVSPDVWPPPDDSTATHVDLVDWAQAMVVYPASFHFLARLALGLADTPALLAAQCTSVPVVVAPSVPPGGTQSPVYRSHLAALGARRNVAVAHPQPGRSLTTGRLDAAVPPPLPEVLALVERCTRDSHGRADGPAVVGAR